MAHPTGTSPLRAITVRLSSTPPKQLPHIVSYLANDIGQCTTELSSPSSQSKNSSESAVLVHKLKTQISALLQGKHIEERWSAVVLVKATVEAGGWEVLQSSGAWVRGMLTVLGVRVVAILQISIIDILCYNPMLTVAIETRSRRY